LKSFKLLLTAIIAALCLLTRAHAGTSPVKVIVLPFDMHAREDVSKLRRDVMETLASKLDEAGAEITAVDEIKELMIERGIKSFDEKSALSIAGDVAADFAVLGAVSALGNALSVDWRVLDLKTGAVSSLYYKTAPDESALMDKVRAEAIVVYDRMLSALASRPAVKTGPIDRVTVSGNRRLDAEAVLGKLKSKAGEPMNPDDVKEDIAAVFAMGYFDDVSAELSETASGVELRFVVKERPFLRGVSYSGNDKVALEDITAVVTLKPNTVLNHVLIKENAEIIRILYEKQGYYMARVEPVLTYEGLDASITFQIDEGDEVMVKRITIIGANRFSQRELKKLMATREKGLLSFFTGSGKFDEDVLQNDIGLVMAHYFNNGYIQADIIDHGVQLSEDKRWFYVTISLVEGERFSVGNLDVTGDILTTRADLLGKIKLKGGDVFDRSKLGTGIEAIRFLYGDDGFAYAEIAPITTVDPEKRLVDVVIDIRKNDPVYVEKIDISNNVKTRDKVIRREVEVDEGDLYSATGLKRSKGNLKRTGYFEEVEILESLGSDRDKMKLDVDVTERPTGSFSVGIGFSSVDSIIGTASISQSNLLGTGLKLDVSGTVSGSSTKYVIGFTEPWLFDKPISAGFDLYNTSREYPDFDIEKNGGDLRFGFPLYKRSARGYVTYKYEEVSITNVDDAATLEIKDQEGDSAVSSVTNYVVYDTRNDAYFPSEGTNASATVEYAGGFLGGTTNFVKYELAGTAYTPLFWNAVFSLRGTAGYVQTFAGKEIPIYERFYLGGINTLRGFETRSVGPVDPVTGDLIGGDVMLLANAEILFPIFGVKQKNFRGVLFYDVGNTWDGRIKIGQVRHGAGGGIRWFSPFGPIRLELGFNLDRAGDEDATQWEFGMGTSF
jgi:outer membrane protein insertion porin family